MPTETSWWIHGHFGKDCSCIKPSDAGASPKDSTSYEYAEANAAFGSGQAATMLQWNAAFGSLNNPEENPAVAGKIGTVAPPAGPAGRVTHIHGLGLGLNKNSKNKDAAIKFLDGFPVRMPAKPMP